MDINIFIKLIDNSKTCVIGSVDSDGYPNARAMLGVRKRNGLKEIYFVTRGSTNKVEQFRNNQKACIYFYDSAQFIGCMLKGKMQVLNDLASKELIWDNEDEIVFSQGINDPDFYVLKFKTENMRVYSNYVSEDIVI